MEDQRSITDDLSLVSGEPERADIAADSGAYADGDTGGDAWAAMEKSRLEASQTETARYNAADHAEVDVAALDLDLIPDGPRDGVDPVQSAEDLGELQHLIRALQALRAEKPMPEDLSSETVREQLLTDAEAEAPDCVDDGCAVQAAETLTDPEAETERDTAERAPEADAIGQDSPDADGQSRVASLHRDVADVAPISVAPRLDDLLDELVVGTATGPDSALTGFDTEAAAPQFREMVEIAEPDSIWNEPSHKVYEAVETAERAVTSSQDETGRVGADDPVVKIAAETTVKRPDMDFVSVAEIVPDQVPAAAVSAAPTPVSRTAAPSTRDASPLEPSALDSAGAATAQTTAQTTVTPDPAPSSLASEIVVADDAATAEIAVEDASVVDTSLAFVRTAVPSSADVAPVDVAPADVAPADVVPVKVVPVDVVPVEVAAAEVGPVEVSPVEAPPVEAPPVDVSPAKAPPAVTPVADIPVADVLPAAQASAKTDEPAAETAEDMVQAALPVETPAMPDVTPVVETAVIETVAVEAPVVETPVVETPVVEPVAVETAAVETGADVPVIDDIVINDAEIQSAALSISEISVTAADPGNPAPVKVRSDIWTRYRQEPEVSQDQGDVAPEQQISVFETVMRGTSSAQQSGNAPEAGQAEDIKITYQRKTSAEASTEEASSVTPAVTPEEVVPETAPEMPPETLPETLPETAPETAPEALAGSLSETAAESTDPMPLFGQSAREAAVTRTEIRVPEAVATTASEGAGPEETSSGEAAVTDPEVEIWVPKNPNLIEVNDRAGLIQALNDVTGGESIALAPGDYGDLFLRHINPASNVEIISQNPDDPAVIRSINLKFAQNLSFDGITFAQSSASKEYYFATVGIYDAQNISVTNSAFDSDPVQAADGKFYGSGVGLIMINVDNVLVKDNSFVDLYRGAQFLKVDNAKVQNNELSAIRSDGLNFAEVTDVLVEGNYMHNFRTLDGSGDHPDMLQFWTFNTTKRSENIIIRDNVFDNGDGSSVQSIFMRNDLVDTGQAGTEMYYRNVLIENNLIYNGSVHGITVGETEGLEIRSNTLIYDPDAHGAFAPPRVNVSDDAVDVTIKSNVMHELYKPSSSFDISNNVVIQNEDPNGEGYYGDVFVNGMQRNGDLADFRPITNSEIDAGGIGAQDYWIDLPG